MDPSPIISGRLLDMKHAACFHDILFSHNQNEAFSQADFIFYCAGVRNKKGEKRSSVVEKNKEVLIDVFQDMHFQSVPTIIVISNPVDLIAALINEKTNHQYPVLGTGTLLDTMRFKSLLAEALDLNPSAVKTFVLGEHGAGMLPILSKTIVHDKPIESYLPKTMLNDLIQQLINSAKAIRSTENASRHGVAQCAIELFDALQSEQTEKMVVSVQLPDQLQREFACHQPIFMGLVCEVSKNKVQPKSNWICSLDEFSDIKQIALKMEEAFIQLLN